MSGTNPSDLELKLVNETDLSKTCSVGCRQNNDILYAEEIVLEPNETISIFDLPNPGFELGIRTEDGIVGGDQYDNRTDISLITATITDAGIEITNSRSNQNHVDVVNDLQPQQPAQNQPQQPAQNQPQQPAQNQPQQRQYNNANARSGDAVIDFNAKRYKLVGWRNRKDPLQHLRRKLRKGETRTYHWYIENPSGETILEFDLDGGIYTVENADNEVIAKIGDPSILDKEIVGEIGSGDVVYSTKIGSVILNIDHNITGGGEAVSPSSGEVLLTLKSNRIRTMLAFVKGVRWILPRNWTFNSPPQGKVCSAQIKRRILFHQKPIKNIKLHDVNDLSDLKIFGIMCMLAKLSVR